MSHLAISPTASCRQSLVRNCCPYTSVHRRRKFAFLFLQCRAFHFFTGLEGRVKNTTGDQVLDLGSCELVAFAGFDVLKINHNIGLALILNF